MSEPLIIVDVQSGFINEFTHHIPQRVARLIERNEYAPVLFTQFINVPDVEIYCLTKLSNFSDELG
jgi:nicotinamidase-related amidase